MMRVKFVCVPMAIKRRPATRFYDSKYCRITVRSLVVAEML